MGKYLLDITKKLDRNIFKRLKKHTVAHVSLSDSDNLANDDDLYLEAGKVATFNNPGDNALDIAAEGNDLHFVFMLVEVGFNMDLLRY